jgi:hypothetical protein
VATNRTRGQYVSPKRPYLSMNVRGDTNRTMEIDRIQTNQKPTAVYITMLHADFIGPTILNYPHHHHHHHMSVKPKSGPGLPFGVS